MDDNGKHTVGPWDYGKPGKRWVVYPESAMDDGIDYYIAEIIRTHNTEVSELEAKCNARLMAAAPAMLDALRAALGALIDLDARFRECGALHTAEDAYDSFYRENAMDAVSEASAAILKATGAEP